MIEPPRARVAHSMPGRLRLRFERDSRTAAAVEPLLARLRVQSGVQSARFNGAAGSILVEYDPATLTEVALLRTLPVSYADVPAVAGQTRPSTPAAQAVARSWWDADSILARVTGGQIDLRTLVPAILTLLAAQQLLLQGELQAVPWHALLWYSYNLFFQFHLEMRQPPGSPENE